MDFELMRKAISGGKTATKIYCGSYTLVRPIDSALLYRCKDDIPKGYVRVETHYGKSVYDMDGFLLPQFWILQRI